MIATEKGWTADYDVTIFQEFEVRKNRPHLKTESQQIYLPPGWGSGADAARVEPVREAFSPTLAVNRKVPVIFELIGLK